MGFWRKFAVGAKIALGVAIKLNDAKVIKVKELDAAKGVVDVIEAEIAKGRPKQP